MKDNNVKTDIDLLVKNVESLTDTNELLEHIKYLIEGKKKVEESFSKAIKEQYPEVANREIDIDNVAIDDKNHELIILYVYKNNSRNKRTAKKIQLTEPKLLYMVLGYFEIDKMISNHKEELTQIQNKLIDNLNNNLNNTVITLQESGELEFHVKRETESLEKSSGIGFNTLAKLHVYNSIPRVSPGERISFIGRSDGALSFSIIDNYFVLDCSRYINGSINSSYYKQLYESMNPESLFSSHASNDYFRFEIAFTKEIANIDNNLEDKEKHRLAKEYISRCFTSQTRKVWDYINGKFIKTYSSLCLTEDGKARKILNNVSITFTVNELARTLGLEPDTANKNRLLQDISFLAFCKIKVLRLKKGLTNDQKKKIKKILQEGKFDEDYIKNDFDLTEKFPEDNLPKVTSTDYIDTFSMREKIDKGGKSIEIVFNDVYANALLLQNTYKTPLELFEIPSSNPSAYMLGQYLIHYAFISNTEKEKNKKVKNTKQVKDRNKKVYIRQNSNILAVTKLQLNNLLKVTVIPNIEQAKELYGSSVNYNKYIKLPLLKALKIIKDTLGDRFNYKIYCYDKSRNKKELNLEEPDIKNIPIEEFLSYNLAYSFCKTPKYEQLNLELKD
jgi:hypothetical protein